MLLARGRRPHWPANAVSAAVALPQQYGQCRGSWEGANVGPGRGQLPHSCASLHALGRSRGGRVPSCLPRSLSFMLVPQAAVQLRIPTPR